MTKEELSEYLKENLEIKIEYHKGRVYYDTTTLKVELSLEGEVICSSTEYIYEV